MSLSYVAQTADSRSATRRQTPVKHPERIVCYKGERPPDRTLQSNPSLITDLQTL